jgi:hypothetical protein
MYLGTVEIQTNNNNNKAIIRAGRAALAAKNKLVQGKPRVVDNFAYVYPPHNVSRLQFRSRGLVSVKNLPNLGPLLGSKVGLVHNEYRTV